MCRIQRSLPCAFCSSIDVLMPFVCKLHTNHSDYNFCSFWAHTALSFVWLCHLVFVPFGHVGIDAVFFAPHNKSQWNRIEWIPVGMTTMSMTTIEKIEFDTKYKNSNDVMGPFIVYSENVSLTFWSKYAEKKNKVQMKTENPNGAIKRETLWNRIKSKEAIRISACSFFLLLFISLSVAYLLRVEETERRKKVK